MNLSKDFPIKGIVLAAGNSTRMKTDKSFIHYHHLPQYEYVAQQLSQFCNEVCINGHPKKYDTQFKVFLDDPEYQQNGPISGVLSASKYFPDQSLFILACDYPFLSTETLKILFDNFLTHQKTVCFRNSDSHFIEPLIAIYHLNDLKKLMEFYNSGQTSLSGFLESINAVILDCNTNKELLSVDEPL